MLFQAHMVANTLGSHDSRIARASRLTAERTHSALICLHRPRSDLVFARILDATACTPPRRVAEPVTSQHMHSAKAIHAANALSNLITLPMTLSDHTPFFTCAITLGAIVQLSAYVTRHRESDFCAVTQRIRLAVAALKSSKESWAIAETLYQQVKDVARQAFAMTTQYAHDPLIDAVVQPPSNVPVSASIAGNDDLWLGEFVRGSPRDA